MKQNKMPPGTLILLVFACIFIIVALTLMMRACSNDPLKPRPKSYTSTHSSAAIGHKGLYEMLRLMKVPVVRGASDILITVGVNGTLVIAEPDLSLVDKVANLKIMTAPRLLLVLPKWDGYGDPKRIQWLSEAEECSLGVADSTLELLIEPGNSLVIRVPGPPVWTTNTIGFAPTIKGNVQLIRSKELRPLVATKDGVLLGEIKDGDRLLWVLADPDVMNNHGLGEGKNAAFMFALLDKLRYWQNDDLNAPLVFDETVHGYLEQAKTKSKYQSQPDYRRSNDVPDTIFDMLFKPPFVVVTILIVLAALLLLVCALRRFGAPIKPKPSLDYGKAQLLSNGARLLNYSGHQAEILRRYVRMTVRSVAQNLHAPHNLSEQGLVAWLDQVGKARSVSKSCREIIQKMSYLNTNDQLDLTLLFEAVREIHRWKGEMLNGSTTNRRHR